MLRQRVHAVFDYWDGPRLGVADYQNVPHAFRCIFDENADDWTDTFAVKRLSASEFAACVRSWQIWLRWEAAFKAGRTTVATHPALPEDRAEKDALQPIVDKAMDMERGALKVRGEFSRGSSGELFVVWS